MNLYSALAAFAGSADARTLSHRLSDWHDEMVAHERQLRVGKPSECADDCPHVTARELWAEALSTFGDRARELVYLRAKGEHRKKPVGRVYADDSAMARQSA